MGSTYQGIGCHVQLHTTCIYRYVSLLSIFGREPRLPLDILTGMESEVIEKTTWVSLHQERLQEAYRIANKKLQQEADARKQLYDKKAKESPLELGQKVVSRNRKVNKIQDAWDGEVFKVTSKLGNNDVYVVEPVTGFGQQKTLNRRDLRPFDVRLDDVGERRKAAPQPESREPNSDSSDSSDDGNDQRYMIEMEWPLCCYSITTFKYFVKLMLPGCGTLLF